MICAAYETKGLFGLVFLRKYVLKNWKILYWTVPCTSSISLGITLSFRRASSLLRSISEKEKKIPFFAVFVSIFQVLIQSLGIYLMAAIPSCWIMVARWITYVITEFFTTKKSLLNLKVTNFLFVDKNKGSARINHSVVICLSSFGHIQMNSKLFTRRRCNLWYW